MDETMQLVVFLGLWALGMAGVAWLFRRGHREQHHPCSRCAQREAIPYEPLCNFCKVDAMGSLLLSDHPLPANYEQVLEQVSR